MRIGKRTALLGAVSLLTAVGVSCAIAVPANAEPVSPNPASESLEAPLVGVGSDTIQDLFTGLTHSVSDLTTGKAVFASYDAFGTAAKPLSAQITPRVLGSTFDRPGGSGPGLDALRSAVEGGTHTVPNNGGTVVLKGSDVQFARSSGAQTITPGGRYAQIPIAIDAVTYVTNGGTGGTQVPNGIPLGGAPTGAPGTVASPAPLTLSNIFAGNGYLSDGTHNFFSGSGNSSDAGFPKLHVYVPQPGSGTYKFWQPALGLTALGNGVLQTFNGSPTIEHDGTPINGDPLAIEPFSIAQWIAQSHAPTLNSQYSTGGVIQDRRNNVVLNNVGSVAPTVAGVLNTAFPIARPVFVDVEYAQLKINPYLKAAFVDDSSFALTSSIYDAVNPGNFVTSVITDFGFAKIPAGGFTPTTNGVPHVSFKQGDADDYRFN